MIKETHAYLRVQKSTVQGAGRGVFARVAIAKGDTLEVTGFRVRRASLADRCTHYADAYKFRVGRDLLIPSGYGGMINHSLRPNLVKIVIGTKVFLRALRSIKVGEELFHRYRRDALKRFTRCLCLGLFIGFMRMSTVASAISKITIVALGDSTTAGTPYAPSYGKASGTAMNPEAPYTYWVGKRHPEWTVLNRGINGERSDQIRARFDSQVLPAHPKYVIILAGVNDTYSGYPMERTEENLRAMYRESKAHGMTPILCTILPFDQAAPEDQEKIRSLNRWILLESQTSKNAVVDLNQIARDPKNPDRLRGSPDGLHPDLATYKLMGEAVADLLDHLEKAP